MEWPDFLESFKKRHPVEYAREVAKIAPGRAKEAPKAPVAKEEPKPAPAPAQADLPMDNKSRAAGEDDWDGFEQAEVVETTPEGTETEVVE